ncbi:radical SAM protein [Bacteroidota bacterium]
MSSPGDIHLLLEKANCLRNEVIGEEIKIIGNIRISNYCEENCLYCPQRGDNLSLDRFRLTAEKIIDAVKSYSNMGLNEIILRSGHDTYFDSDMISYIIYSIKQSNDISVTLSLCERDFDEYKSWQIAGADQYILKHITANPMLFSIYPNGNNMNKRIDHLKRLREIGFKTGTGSIIDLPNQTEEDIAEDILLSRELGVNLLSLSSFTPMESTPYHTKNGVNDHLILKAVAAARFAVNDLDIPVYTPFGSRELPVKEKMLNGGANVLIVNFNSIRHIHKQPTDAGKDKSSLEISWYNNKTKCFIRSI